MEGRPAPELYTATDPNNPNLNCLCPTQDLYDKARIGLVKTIKAEGTNWVSK